MTLLSRMAAPESVQSACENSVGCALNLESPGLAMGRSMYVAVLVIVIVIVIGIESRACSPRQSQPLFALLRCDTCDMAMLSRLRAVHAVRIYQG